MIQHAIEVIRDLQKSKTAWLCVAGLAGVGEQWSQGEITGKAAAFAALFLCIQLTQRHATEKVKQMAAAEE